MNYKESKPVCPGKREAQREMKKITAKWMLVLTDIHDIKWRDITKEILMFILEKILRPSLTMHSGERSPHSARHKVGISCKCQMPAHTQLLQPFNGCDISHKWWKCPLKEKLEGSSLSNNATSLLRTRWQHKFFVWEMVWEAGCWRAAC